MRGILSNGKAQDMYYKWSSGQKGKDLKARLYFNKDRDLHLYKFSINRKALGICETMGPEES